MAKAHESLRHAIINGLTEAQRKELETLISNMAQNAKMYGAANAIRTSEDVIQLCLKDANSAWSALGAIGLNVEY